MAKARKESKPAMKAKTKPSCIAPVAPLPDAKGRCMSDEQNGKKIGRPSIYTEELGDLICSRLADGEGLKAICGDAAMPDEKTVRRWALEGGEHPFGPRYARARRLGYERLADEIIEISDGIGGMGATDDNARVQRAKLQVDSRKWLLSKVLPKIYGDHVRTELTGANGGPIEVDVVVDHVELARRLCAISPDITAILTNPVKQLAVIEDEINDD